MDTQLLKSALRLPATYLVFSINVITVLYAQGLIHPGTIYSQWISAYVSLLGLYGIVGLVSHQVPRVPWDESQREAFRNTHPNVQEKAK